ncbi:MAG: right-handed parallel beta-helix repeat-containing protein [Planctomycetota bacterium]|jgi:hypothetical protein
MKKLITICFVVVFVLAAGSPAQAATLIVRAPGGVGALGDIYTSIQDAIDDANDGDTLVIHDGTYDETINIEGFNGLTLRGTDKTTVIIQSSTTLDWNVGTYGSSRQAVFRIVNSTGVVIENMTMDFDLVRANFVFGVMGWDSSVTVDNCILKNMSVDDLSGGYYDIGSYFRAPGYTDVSRADVTVTNSTFIDMGRQGVATHDYVNADISGNTFYKTTDDFGYAIEIGSESVGSVTGNTIYGYDTPAASDGSESAGIYIEPAFTGRLHGGPISVVKPVTVQGNEVYDCQYAMWIGNGYDGFAGDVDIVINVTGNNFHNNVDGAVILQDEDAEDGSSINATFQGNTVTDNNLVGYHIFTNGDGDITASFSGETITGHATAIAVSDSCAVSSSSYSVQVRNSNLSNNSSYGVDNAVSSIVVDAIENCWGDPTGPYHPVTNPGGLGSQVSDNVSYYPWYLDCTYADPAYKPVHNVTLGAYYDTIQEGIDAAREGDTITADPCTYDETVLINVDNLTIVGIEGSLPTITGGVTLASVSGLTLENFIITGDGGSNSVIRMTGAVTDLTLDNCVLDGENVSGRMGLTGGQLEGDVTITNCEFKNILGWAVLDSRSGSGGDGSAMGTVTFAHNNTHHCNGSIVFRGLSSDRTDVVNAYDNTWESIGGNEGETGQHWAALEINRTVQANVYENEVNDVSECEWGEGQALQLWDIDTLDVHDNTFTNNFQGIMVYGTAYGTVFAVPGGSVYCNTLSGNSDFGIKVDPTATGGPLDAEFNWWGDASGPSGNGGGFGDAVLGNVDFFPWLLSTDCGDFTLHITDFVVDDDWASLSNWSTVTVGGVDYYIGLNAFAVIQDAIDAASDGNSISVLEGTYDESPNITESLTLKSLDGKDVTNIVLQPSTTYLGALTINASDVLVEGFTITGFDAVDNGLASSNIVVVSGKSNVEIADNRILVGKIGPGSNGDDGFGLLTYYSTDNVADNLNVHDNVIEPVATEGARAFYINPGIDHFAFSNNTIAGTFTRTAITQAMNGLVQNNILTGTGSSAGLGTWGYPDPTVWGHTEFTGNTITDTQRAIALYSTEDVYINNNSLYANEVGVYVMEYSGTFDASTIRIKNNNIFDNNSAGVDNTVSDTVDATYNWWGDVSGPNDPCGTSETDGAVCYDVSTIKNADGLGDSVSEGNANYCPWLVAPTCSSAYPCLAGDLNFDGCVDWRDFAIFALSWLEGCD